MPETLSRRGFLRFSASALADMALRRNLPMESRQPQETTEKDMLLNSAFETLGKIYGPDIENLNYHLLPRDDDNQELVITKTQNLKKFAKNPSTIESVRGKKRGELKEYILAGTPLSALAETGIYCFNEQGHWSYQRRGLEIEIPFHPLPPTKEKWLEVDLSDQLLSAYQGGFPVYASRVSTGTDRFPTPTGEYHINAKHESTRMRGPGYDVPDVPFTLYYYNSCQVPLF